VSGTRSVGCWMQPSISFTFRLYCCNLSACLPACLPACLLPSCYCFVLISWMSALWTLPNCPRAPAFAFLSPPPSCSLLVCSQDQLIPTPSAPLLPPLSPSSSSFFPSCTFRFLTVGLYFLQLASEQQVFHLLWSVRSRHTHALLSLSLSLSLSLKFTSTIFRY
jgi:hypothetical protein